MKKRNIRLDSLKGFLIILVILGHIPGDYNLKYFIYVFHMPLFVLLSGYFTKTPSDLKGLWYSLKGIAKPLILFQVIYVSLDYVIFERIEIASIITPFWILWYLMSLILWRIFTFLFQKPIHNDPFLFFLVAIMIALFSGYCPIRNPFSLQRTLNFFPFFLAGLYLRQRADVLSSLAGLGGAKIASIIVIVISVIVVWCGLYPEKMYDMLRGAHSYVIQDFPVKLLLIIWSFSLSFAFLLTAKENRILSIIGKDSLVYYLLHGLLVRFVLKPFIAYYDLPANLLISLFYCTIVVVIIYMLNKNKYVRRLVYVK